MSGSGQEIEAKFYLLHLDRMMARLQELQARLIQPRVLEINLRFDLPDNSLRSQGRVLRLRRDTEARLTYKGPGSNDGGVLGREEIEFVVDDFDKAQQFLEALGYQQTIYYEKYRTTYVLESNSLLFEDQKHTPSGTRASGFQSCLIMLDELPYGNFIEIEGESAELIQNVAAKLELKWKTAIGTSYTALFENVRRSLQLPFRELSFKNFEGLKITLDDLNVQAADHRLSFK
jgi:adenylate cyclase class 2